jgi:hypothetical protein
LARVPAAIGLGVYPDRRSSAALLEQIALGAPTTRQRVRSSFGGEPGLLRQTLDRAGVTVSVEVEPAMRGTPTSALARAFLVPGAHFDSSSSGRVRPAQIVVAIMRIAPKPEAFAGSTTIVMGVGRSTPVLVGLIGRRGVLSGGITRRAAIVTPYDVAATVLVRAGIQRPDTFIGKPLHVEARDDALGASRKLARRLERDASFGFAYTAATVGVALGGLALALALGLVRRRDAAARVLQGVSLAPLGYVGGLFVGSGRAEVRSIALVAAFLLGAMIRPVRTRRFCGLALAATGAIIVALAIAAAARPDGEPALSLWGDPLVSWRFFGLRNHLIAFLAGSIVVAAGLLAAQVWTLALALVAIAIVTGAPQIGANFVGVLTLVFGGAVALLLRREGRLRAWHLPAAAAAGIAAFAIALLADTGSPASHGGLAVRRIRAGGVDAALDFVRVRAQLNGAEIRDFFAGIFLVMLLVGFCAGAFVWATRRSSADAALRSGVAGSTAAALAALALEDSGFFTAAVLSLFAGIGVLIFFLDRLRATAAEPTSSVDAPTRRPPLPRSPRLSPRLRP